MKTLRARLFATTLATLALTLTLTVAIGAVLAARQVDRSQAAAVQRRADDLAQQRREHVTYENVNSLGPHGGYVIEPRSFFLGLVPNVNRSSNGEIAYLGQRELYAYRTLPARGLLVLHPVDTTAWRPLLNDLLIAALAGVGFAAVVSFFAARSILRPVRRVADATRAVAARERQEPLPVEGTAELAALSRAFNQMVEQLAASREAERNFLLSVSHELKTPLTAIRGYAEGLADGAFRSEEAARVIALEAGRLERLVRDLLDLARMQRAEFAVRREPVDLAEVAREAVRRHAATAQDFGVELTADGEESWVEADQDRVLQVTSNLVENALRETPAGGRVTVSARPGLLAVADTGPGIAPEDIPHAFERFYLYDKLSRDRPVGSGLGLAIVKQLALAMRGDVSVRSDGGGTTFELRLPSGPQRRGVDDLEVVPVQRAERV